MAKKKPARGSLRSAIAQKRSPRAAAPSRRDYPHAYAVTTASADDAREFVVRATLVGMGPVGYKTRGAVVTFRTEEPLDLARPGTSSDAIVRLTHTFDADIRSL